jgi:hypothetical protein
VKFCQKVKFKIQNSKKKTKSGLEGFPSSEVRGKKREIFADTYLIFIVQPRI